MASRMLIIDTSDEFHPLLNASDLCQIHSTPRYIFLFLVSVLFVCTLVGNLSALYVNSSRKLRPFFRACLISLACSDLMYCINFTTSNIALFRADYLEYWILGPFMCYLIPFVNTTTVLCSSFMLVVIALDRYMSIRRAAVGIWTPHWLLCVLCIGGIWLACMGVAVPLFFIYKPIRVYIQTTDELIVSEIQQVTMCVGRRTQVGIYNGVSLSLVFVPCIVAFIFLHVTIAQQLWQRRHQLRSLKRQQQQSMWLDYPLGNRETAYAVMSAFSVAACVHTSAAQMTQQPQQERKMTPAAVARVARHRRMVKVVLLMMGAFICLRLPAWIFLMMRVYGSFSSPLSWLFYFSFGLLNLTSCALNPLFYTFLPQTLRVLSQLKLMLCWLLCCGRAANLESDAPMPSEAPEQAARGLCFGLHVTWRCQLKLRTQQTVPAAKEPVSIIELPSIASSSLSKEVFKDLSISHGLSLPSPVSIKSLG
ncbi:PREDICTED: neuropeptide Y receptor [Drosophila arizonae]|uniref:Neuropeptide Y receptor n=1 Tax=Drosophila arizonae TaxID=7263 RepID=A0ABM1PC46_DROAR|nr:PREDICTED: neuropeptide Y receptor [Drosophila arizonae]